MTNNFQTEMFNEVLDSFEGGYRVLDKIIKAYVKDDFTLHDLVELVCSDYGHLWFKSYYELSETMLKDLKEYNRQNESEGLE